jgi:PAS domain S-box-containing protein
MKKDTNSEAAKLRQKAEALLKKNPSTAVSTFSEADNLKLIHEIEVLRIELELQNEELVKANEQARNMEQNSSEISEIFENAASGEFKLTKNGEIVNLNRRGSQLLGEEKSHLKNRQFGFFLTNDTKPVFNHFLDKIFESKERSTAEVSLSVIDSLLLYVHLSGIISNDKEHCFVTMVDITERKSAEEAIIESERLLKESQTIARLGSFVWNLSTGLWESSYILDEIFGIDENYIRSFDGWKNIVHSNWQEKMSDYVTSEVLGMNHPFDKEYQIVRIKDGKERWVHGLAELERDDNNQPIKLIGTISDITNRKNAESVLHFQSEILSHINEAVYMVRMDDGIIVYTNSQFEEMFGYGPGEMQGKHVSIVNAPTEISPLETAKEIMDSLEVNGYWIGEIKNVKKDGTAFWSHAKVITFDHSQFGKVLVDVHEDITERKQAEEAMTSTLSLLNATLESTFDGILVLDRDDSITLYNHKFANMWQIPEEYLTNKIEGRVLNHVLAQMNKPKEFLNRIKELYKQPDEISFDILYLRDGHIFEAYSQPQRNGDDIVGRAWSFHDITERMLAEEALRKSNEQFDTLVAKIPVGIYILHSKPDGFYALDYVSPKMAEILNLSIEDLMSDASLVIQSIHPDDRQSFLKMNEEGIQLHRPFNWKGRIVVDDKIKWLHFRSIPETVNGGDILWHGLIIDISERVEAEAEIRLKNDELSRLITQKNKFFSIIAHDLRSPFNAFLGFTRIMAEELPTLTMEEIQTIAVTMKNSADNLFRLLGNLLQWSQMEQGLIAFNPVGVQLTLVIDESLSTVMESAKSKGIKIISYIPSGIKIFADNDMLQSIIRNVASNAVKFTPKGGNISLTAKIADEKFVEIAIKDSGIGMSTSIINNLFRTDTQMNRKGTEGESSTGLGLLICKEFVEIHGGRIWAESVEGHGSVFYITIPLMDENNGKTKGINAKAEEGQIKKLKILIAEDDELSSVLLLKTLKSYSYETLTVRNGKEAVKICQNNPDIDLILMDIQMPEFDGYEATKQIRKFNTKVIIIAQTAFALQSYRDKALEAGCNEYILKPIDKNELIGLINKHLKRKKL